MLCSSGCMTVHLSADGYDKQASLTISDKKYTVVKHFRHEVKAWYGLFNLVPLSTPDVGEILRHETAGAQGDAVCNLTVRGEISVTDVLLPVAAGLLGSSVIKERGIFALFLVGSRTYIIEGDVIKYIDY